MLGNGLRQVSNPSEILISQREDNLSGISIGASLEGNRPLLIEIQSLVSPAAYGTPQRSSTGFDSKRRRTNHPSRRVQGPSTGTNIT